LIREEENWREEEKLNCPLPQSIFLYVRVHRPPVLAPRSKRFPVAAGCHSRGFQPISRHCVTRVTATGRNSPFLKIGLEPGSAMEEVNGTSGTPCRLII